MNIKETVETLSKEQPWIYRFLLGNSLFTPGPKSKGPKNEFKIKAIQGLGIRDKRVLDVGCAEGMFSFYMAAEGARVTGLEVNEARLKKAEFVKQILGISEVNFRRFDAESSQAWHDIEADFDVAFCFSLMHRVSDPFNLLAEVSKRCKTLVLEWKAPEGLFSDDFSIAIHETEGRLDPRNIKQRESLISPESIMDSGLERPYWTMSPGALKQILFDFGFNHFKLVRITRTNRVAVTYAYLHLLYLSLFNRGHKPFSWRRTRRLLMICDKTDSISIEIPKKLKRQIWDGTTS